MTQTLAHDTLRIARRFNGPHDSGNGGYSAGLVAAFLQWHLERGLRSLRLVER